MARISWHPAFVQAIEHEFVEYREILDFEAEHQLTAEPLKIDVLIIKKKKDIEIKKNIGQIFRLFNVVEYKSPNDHVTVEAYHKTQCHSRLYASQNKVDIADMSVTVVATRHPRKLLAFLKDRYTVKHTQRGIYLVEGDTSPTQVLVSEELSKEENLWLNSLRNDLSAEQFERAAKSKERGLPMDAFFRVIGEANAKILEELYMKKNGVVLTEKLDAYFNEKYAIPREIQMGRNMVITFLRAKFAKIPKRIENAINQMNDSVALESLAAHAGHSDTMEEFAEALK
jgi:hypothetical protein